MSHVLFDRSFILLCVMYQYPSIVPVQAIVGGTRQNTSTQEAGQYDQNGQGKSSSGNPQQEAQQQKPDVVPDNKS